MPTSFEPNDTKYIFEKTKREYAKLQKAIDTSNDLEIRDALFNFTVTCYHVKDWVRASKQNKENVEAFVENTKELRVCGDICNRNKHFNISRDSIVKNVYTSTTSTLDKSPSTVPLYGSDYKIKILMDDGIKFEILEFGKKCIEIWTSFFKRNLIV